MEFRRGKTRAGEGVTGMAVNIVVPELSESVVEATVSEWLKGVGDKVEAGETLVVLETDKVALEVAAASAGVIARIDFPAGTDVAAKTVLGVIDETGAGVAPAPSVQPVGAVNNAPTTEPAAAPATANPAAVRENEGAKTAASATPVAQRVAAAHGVDIAQVPAAGSKVTKNDVQNFVSGQGAAPAPAATPPPAPKPAPAPASTASPSMNGSNGRREERVRMSRRRQAIARNLLQAQSTAAMLTTFNEIDMSKVMEIRSRRKESFQKKYNVGLGFSSFFVKATIGALKAFPALNAEIQNNNEIVLKHYYDIGMAIGADEGLVVPVIRDADRMSFAQIEQQIKDYAQQAKDGTLTLEALMGGTFSITNGGVFGSMMSTPILNPPQVGILGLHAIKERPVVVNGEIVIRPMMYIALTYDHRIVDGREAVQFLVKIKDLMEDPESLLIEG
jgi:2-oxoglutarate dehydrogenase E2 component (dihydrolipoamide succinyltransferase)